MKEFGKKIIKRNLEMPLELAVGAIVNGKRENKEIKYNKRISLKISDKDVGSFTDFKSITVSIPSILIEENAKKMVDGVTKQGEQDKIAKYEEYYNVAKNTSIQDVEKLVYATAMHEAAHILYTNNEEREKLVELIVDDLGKDIVDNKLIENFVTSLMYSFDNILEDGRIENLLANKHKGVIDAFKYLNLMLITKFGLINYKYDSNNEPLYINLVDDIILSYTKTGLDSPLVNDIPKEAQEAFERIKPLINTLVTERSSATATLKKYNIYRELKPFLIDFIDENRENIDLINEIIEAAKDLTDRSVNSKPLDDAIGIDLDQLSKEELEEVLENLKNQKDNEGNKGNEDDEEPVDNNIFINIPIPSTSSQDGDDKDEKDKENKDENQSSGSGKDEENEDENQNTGDGNDKENEGKENEDTNQSSSNGNNKDDEEDEDYSKDDKITKNKESVSIKDYENAVQKEIDRAKADVKTPEEKVDLDRQAEMNAPKSKADQAANNISGMFKVSERNTFNEVKLEDVALTKLPYGIKAESRRLEKVVEAFFNKPTFNLGNRRSGILDERGLTKLKLGDPKVFKTKGSPEKTDKAIMICWDGSGSMMGSKFREAGRACSIIEEAFSKHVALKIVVFTTNYNGTSHYLIKDFEDNKENVNYSYSIGKNLDGMNGNNDGMTVKIATEELKLRPERDKTIIVLSDGMPTGSHVNLSPENLLKKSVQDARDEGIEVVSIFFGSKEHRRESEGKYKEMYKKNIINSPVEDITKNLSELLKELVLTR